MRFSFKLTNIIANPYSATPRKYIPFCSLLLTASGCISSDFSPDIHDKLPRVCCADRNRFQLHPCIFSYLKR